MSRDADFGTGIAATLVKNILVFVLLQGSLFSPHSASGRLVYGLWLFVAMVIAATYTAKLASQFSVILQDMGESHMTILQ